MKGLSMIKAALQILLVAVLTIPMWAAAATVEYIHTDALGSPVAVTNSVGQVIERREYEPYGHQQTPTTLANGPGYTGHVTDASTGLTYMQQRYYDPMIGRFLSVDPVTAYGGDARYFNRYWYAAGNPYKYTDPDGRVLDTIADIGFIAYSAYTLATDPSWTNAAALGADVVGAAVPFATGLGAGVRAVAHGADAVKAADKAADAGKGAAAANRAESRAKGVPDSQIGPSGKPKVHTVEHSTRKGAKEAAQRETPPGGRVRNDASPKDGQKPHFQAENAKGENVKPVVHHCKPGKAC